jgi:hypothetical protein
MIKDALGNELNIGDRVIHKDLPDVFILSGIGPSGAWVIVMDKYNRECGFLRRRILKYPLANKSPEVVRAFKNLCGTEDIK